MRLFLRVRGLGFWSELRTLGDVCTGVDEDSGDGESVGVFDRCGGTGAFRPGANADEFAAFAAVPARRAVYS